MLYVAQAAVHALTERLIIEYAGAVAAAGVINAVGAARQRLAGARDGSGPSVELLEEVVRRELVHEVAISGLRTS